MYTAFCNHTMLTRQDCTSVMQQGRTKERAQKQWAGNDEPLSGQEKKVRYQKVEQDVAPAAGETPACSDLRRSRASTASPRSGSY